MSQEHTVRVDNGKYTFRKAGLAIEVDRHDRRGWVTLHDGTNALSSMMSELDAARVVIAAARSLVKRGEAPPALVNALELHGRLVDDREHPSEWTCPSEPRVR